MNTLYLENKLIPHVIGDTPTGLWGIGFPSELSITGTGLEGDPLHVSGTYYFSPADSHHGDLEKEIRKLQLPLENEIALMQGAPTPAVFRTADMHGDPQKPHHYLQIISGVGLPERTAANPGSRPSRVLRRNYYGFLLCVAETALQARGVDPDHVRFGESSTAQFALSRDEIERFDLETATFASLRAKFASTLPGSR